MSTEAVIGLVYMQLHTIPSAPAKTVTYIFLPQDNEILDFTTRQTVGIIQEAHKFKLALTRFN